jgi:hypothetical protein
MPAPHLVHALEPSGMALPHSGQAVRDIFEEGRGCEAGDGGQPASRTIQHAIGDQVRVFAARFQLSPW